ncbi:hypothetical protein [uncultured Clostridium sp.]|uniref:hypothetical protein n=1 Tax=uncultured Clostridium sp. TaxID=59620 RepID=UPI0028E1FBB4|nr:hypothetical protein [uncultured Clostridium sp.]
MNAIERVIMNLKIKPYGMSFRELNEVCFAAYKKILVGSTLLRPLELMEPTLNYLEETGQIIIEDEIVKLKER